MENLVFLMSALFTFRLATKETFRNYRIGKSGASLEMPSSFRGFTHTTTSHSDDFYLGECSSGKAEFGILYIELNQEYDLSDAETMLSYYITKLQEPFNIAHNTGIGQCICIDEKSGLRKLEDYWQDDAGTDWKLKGYTDGKFVAVLYVQNISEITVEKLDQFLDGLRIPLL
jgi:hypothetical protein